MGVIPTIRETGTGYLARKRVSETSNSKGVGVEERGTSEKQNYHASLRPSPDHLPFGATGAPLRASR